MEHVCPICLDADDEAYLSLKCNHTYHIKCMSEWLKENDTCPECRSKVEEDSDIFPNYHKKSNSAVRIHSPRPATIINSVPIRIFSRRITRTNREPLTVRSPNLILVEGRSALDFVSPQMSEILNLSEIFLEQPRRLIPQSIQTRRLPYRSLPPVYHLTNLISVDQRNVIRAQDHQRLPSFRRQNSNQPG